MNEKVQEAIHQSAVVRTLVGVDGSVTLVVFGPVFTDPRSTQMHSEMAAVQNDTLALAESPFSQERPY